MMEMEFKTDESLDSTTDNFVDPDDLNTTGDGILCDETPEPEPEPDHEADGDVDGTALEESPNIKRRKSYENAFKLEAIKLAESVGNRKAAKSLGLDESNIREWRKRKAEIEKLPLQKRTKRHAKPRWLDLEAQLAQWYLDRKSRNLYVTTNMVKEKGMELATEFGYEDFSGSSGWVTRFMTRLKHNGGNFATYTSPKRPQQSHAPPEFLDRLQTFRSFFSEKRSQSELKRRNGIISFDEVPLALDMPCGDTSTSYLQSPNPSPSCTTDSLIPPAEKINFTVVLSASAAGGKLPPLLIFQGKSLPKEAILVFPDGIVVRSNDKGWVTPNLIEDWVENCWKKWLWPSRSEDNVLILDSCKTHISQEVKFKCSKHFQMQFIPRGLGQHLHPLEIGVNKSFKDNVLKQWEHWVLDQACGGIDSENDGDSYSRKVENYLTISNWVLEAWKDISPNVIMNGFAKAGIESFTPEDVVQAILNDCGDNGEIGEDMQHSNVMLFPDHVNLVGDEFDGWD